MSWKRGYHPANVLSKAWLFDFIPSKLNDASSWQYVTVLVDGLNEVDKPLPTRVGRNNQVELKTLQCTNRFLPRTTAASAGASTLEPPTRAPAPDPS